MSHCAIWCRLQWRVTQIASKCNSRQKFHIWLLNILLYIRKHLCKVFNFLRATQHASQEKKSGSAFDYKNRCTKCWKPNIGFFLCNVFFKVKCVHFFLFHVDFSWFTQCFTECTKTLIVTWYSRNPI